MSLESEISPVILLDQSEVFQYHCPCLFVWHIEHFFFDQLIADGFRLRGSVIHQIFF